MRLHGQRWIFQIGNSTVKIDNAFSWTSWAQERMIVNDEVLFETSDSAISRTFKEPWLTPDGEGELVVKIYSGVMSIICEAKLNGERIEPDACYSAQWTSNARHWPAESAWDERPIRHKISFIRSGPRKPPTKG